MRSPDRQGPSPLVSHRVAVCLVFLHMLLSSGAVAWAGPGERSEVALQQLVDALRNRLAIPHPVTVTLVASNPKIVSVAAPAFADAPFELAIEADFLATLSDEELAAVLAHELGHVWVFTHHPFLQTERLANEVAMRAVSRDSLERVYEKMWARTGISPDAIDYLGPRLVAATQASAEP